MAQKFFKYETDTGAKYGASIDADLYSALDGTGTWAAINKAATNGAVYDDFAALDAADADVSEMLPSTLNPRKGLVSIMGQSVSVILPCPLNLAVGTLPDSLNQLYTFTGTPVTLQGEQDFDLTD